MNCDTCGEKFTRVNDLIEHVSKIRFTYQCSHFFCTPCSLPLYNLSSVVQHIDSEEHSIMTLATGVCLDIKAESSVNFGVLFPPTFCCLLCSCRDGDSHQQHMKSSTHIKTASLMRAIISSKEIHYSDKKTDKHIHKKTQNFNVNSLINKIINLIQNELRDDALDPERLDDSFDCELCNIYFNKSEYYEQHLKDQSHKRMEQFLSKMSQIVEEMDIVCLNSDAKVSETFSNSLPPLYYCEFCCVWLETTVSYVRHAKSITHTRIQELQSKLSNKRNGELITLRGVASTRDRHFYRSKEYCKLCTVWGATGYRRHLKDAGHVRIERFLNSLSNEEDRKFLKYYMNTQAHLKVGDSAPPNYCELCNILYLESKEYKKHLESDEHKYVVKNLPKDKNATGEKVTKKIKTSSSSLQQHYYSARQRAREAYNASPSHEARETSNSSGSTAKSLPQEHYCELCDFLCYNVLHYEKHLTGDQHKRMRRLLNKKGKKGSDVAQSRGTSKSSHPLQHKCELCEVFNSTSQKYERHLDSAMHRKNQWLLYVLKQRPL